MPANADTKLQVNFNIGKNLINVYAEDEVELAQLLDGLIETADKISEAGKALGAVVLVAQELGGTVIPQSTSALPQQAQAAAGAPFGVDPEFCQHGAMKFRSGTSKAGKPYEIYDCPMGECESKWPKRKR